MKNNRIEEVFSIIRDCDKRSLNKGEYMTPEIMKEMEQYNKSLLVAPAGAGKTTAIVNLARSKDGVKRALIVPTTAIAEQLDMKYREDEDLDATFLYTVDGSLVENEIAIEDADLIISTYDQFKRFKGNSEIVLYIDETHEFNTFKGIGSNKRRIQTEIQLSDNKKIYVTATPFNLSNRFDAKVFYKGVNNKDINIIEVNRMTEAIIDMLTVQQNYGKTLVFINSKKKMKSIKEKINQEAPLLRVGTISSDNRNDGYTNLLNAESKEDVEYDIILTTKLLNIGFDINNVFDHLIYADDKTNVNAMLQFINRERQAAKYTILLRSGSNLSFDAFNNINDIEKNEQLKILSDYAKTVFNSGYVEFDDSLYFDRDYAVELAIYNLKLDTNDIIELMEAMYLDFDSSTVKTKEVEFERMRIEGNNKKGKELIEEFFSNHDLKEILNTFGEDGSLYAYNDELSRKSLRNLTHAIRVIFDLLSNEQGLFIVDLDNVSDDRLDAIKGMLTADNVFKLGNSYTRKKVTSLDDSDLVKVLFDAVSNVILPSDRDELISDLNELGLFVNDKKWTNKNFKTNVEHMFGITLVKYQKRVKGKKISGLKNDTYYIEDMIDELN